MWTSEIKAQRSKGVQWVNKNVKYFRLHGCSMMSYLTAMWLKSWVLPTKKKQVCKNNYHLVVNSQEKVCKYFYHNLQNIKSIECPKLKKIGFDMYKRPSIREITLRENIQAFSHQSKLKKSTKNPFLGIIMPNMPIRCTNTEKMAEETPVLHKLC